MPFLHLKNLPVREIIPGYKARFVHSDKMTCAYYRVKAGAPFPEHSHPHEQISNVLEGEFELTIDGETQILKPGLVAIIPSNAIHSGKAFTDCYILDIFHPVREDYR